MEYKIVTPVGGPFHNRRLIFANQPKTAKELFEMCSITGRFYNSEHPNDKFFTTDEWTRFKNIGENLPTIGTLIVNGMVNKTVRYVSVSIPMVRYDYVFSDGYTESRHDQLKKTDLADLINAHGMITNFHCAPDSNENEIIPIKTKALYSFKQKLLDNWEGFYEDWKNEKYEIREE